MNSLGSREVRGARRSIETVAARPLYLPSYNRDFNSARCDRDFVQQHSTKRESLYDE